MCDPSHIQLAVAELERSFVSSVRCALNAKPTDELAARLVAVPRQTITVIILESKNSPEPLGPGELLFLVSNQ
jgi:hypothetical protein